MFNTFPSCCRNPFASKSFSFHWRFYVELVTPKGTRALESSFPKTLDLMSLAAQCEPNHRHQSCICSRDFHKGSILSDYRNIESSSSQALHSSFSLPALFPPLQPSFLASFFISCALHAARTLKPSNQSTLATMTPKSPHQALSSLIPRSTPSGNVTNI